MSPEDLRGGSPRNPKAVLGPGHGLALQDDEPEKPQPLVLHGWLEGCGYVGG